MVNVRLSHTKWKTTVQFKPVSAMSRMVCLMAQMMLSKNSLNCGGGIVNSAKVLCELEVAEEGNMKADQGNNSS